MTKCTKCVTNPELVHSGWSDPAYICPVCKQSWWERNGKFYYEKPEESEKKSSTPKIAKDFVQQWQLPYQKYRQKLKKGKFKYDPKQRVKDYNKKRSMGP